MALETCPWDPLIDDPYESWLAWARRNIQRNADNVFLIDGYEGVGKSTFGMEWVRDFTREKWDPQTGLIFNYNEWYANWKAGTKDQTYVIDEGGNLLFSRDSTKQENKLLVKVLMQMRVLRSTVLILCPNKHWLDPYVRLHRGRFWSHVTEINEERGFAYGMWKEYDWRENEYRWEDAGEYRFPEIPKNHSWVDGYEARKIQALSDTSTGEDRPERRRRRRRRDEDEISGARKVLNGSSPLENPLLHTGRPKN